jgi:hypothetical protein
MRQMKVDLLETLMYPTIRSRKHGEIPGRGETVGRVAARRGAVPQARISLLTARSFLTLDDIDGVPLEVDAARKVFR